MPAVIAWPACQHRTDNGRHLEYQGQAEIYSVVTYK